MRDESASRFEPGRREHDRVVLAFVELAQPRVEVAAQRLDLHVRTQRAQLHDAPQARGADARAVRQFVERRVARRHEGIARVFALEHRGELEAFGQLHRHVFQRMHGELRAPFFERGLELLDEQALAADLRQRAVEDLVAARRHAEQFGAHAEPPLEQRLHMLGLPQRETAFPRGDDDRRGDGHGEDASRPMPIGGSA